MSIPGNFRRICTKNPQSSYRIEHKPKGESVVGMWRRFPFDFLAFLLEKLASPSPILKIFCRNYSRLLPTRLHNDQSWNLADQQLNLKIRFSSFYNIHFCPKNQILSFDCTETWRSFGSFASATRSNSVEINIFYIRAKNESF